MPRFIVVLLLLVMMNLPSVVAQDTSPTIPVGLSSPYLMFVPVGWNAESPNPFGFVKITGAGITLNVLDPVRFEQFVPIPQDTSPRQMLIDYSQFFYVEAISRQQIDLLTIGENIVAVYRDPDLPALATYIVELADHRFALIEVEADDGIYDNNEEPIVHAIIGTLTISTTETPRNDVLYDTSILPSGRYSLSLPPDWVIEPSLVPGQVFLVGDGIEIILFAPDSLAGYFSFPADVNLIELAQIIETEFFSADLTNITITSARAGDRRLVAYGYRSLSNSTDTQALLVQLPDGTVAYFKAVGLQDTITPLLQDRIRRVALSLQAYTRDTLSDDFAGEDIQAIIIPNSGQWRIELRDMMRLVCDGTIERLLPTSNEVRDLFSDFDTIVADPDGDSITVASDGVVTLFQRGTLLREDSPYYQITDSGRGYTVTPLSESLLAGRLNLIVPNDRGEDCRVGVSLLLRYVE